MSTWTFFSNHAHVLFLLGMDSDRTLREVAYEVGITERATQKIISDLEKDGFIKITKIGRQNSYKILGKKHLKHPIEKNCTVDELIKLIKKANRS